MFKRVVSVFLIVTTAMVTAPFSLAEMKRTAPIGTVTMTGGDVQLRGVPLAHEGTIFDGDRIASGSDASARIAISGGPQLLLGPNTDLTVEKQGADLEVVVHSGYVEFSSKSQDAVRLNVAPYQIASNGAIAGSVAAGPETVGVRAMRGELKLTHLETGESRIVTEATPAVVPLPAPRRQVGSVGLSKAAIVGIVAGIGVGVVVLALALTGDDASPSEPD